MWRLDFETGSHFPCYEANPSGCRTLARAPDKRSRRSLSHASHTSPRNSRPHHHHHHRHHSTRRLDTPFRELARSSALPPPAAFQWTRPPGSRPRARGPTVAMSAYGKWHNFCRDSGSGYATIPVCNLFYESRARPDHPPPLYPDYYGGCQLKGINLSGNNHYLANLGAFTKAAEDASSGH